MAHTDTEPTPFRAWVTAALHRLALAIRPNLADNSPIWHAANAGAGITDQPRSVMTRERKRALQGYRENSMLYRAVELKVDHLIGDDGIRPGSPSPELERFLNRFWDHPENDMDARLPIIAAEQIIAGDIFVLMFTDGLSGMSYIRPLPYDMVLDIEVSPTDFEREVAFIVAAGDGTTKRYPAYADDLEPTTECVFHGKINAPVGSLWGQSDLATALDEANAYKQILKDRSRLHWAMRLFNWFVTVPAGKVAEASAKYATPPQSGSIIVKSDSEQWEAITPNIRGADAAQDLFALRLDILAGLGLPPFWFGDVTGMNFSTAQIVEYNTFRNLKRKQRAFLHLLRRMLLGASHRAYVLGTLRKRPTPELITFNIADITKDDDERVAAAWRDLAAGAVDLSTALANLHSPALRRALFGQIAGHIGLEITDELLDTMEQDYAQYEREQRRREERKLAGSRPGSPAGGDGRAGSARATDRPGERGPEDRNPRPERRRDRDGRGTPRPDGGK